MNAELVTALPDVVAEGFIDRLAGRGRNPWSHEIEDCWAAWEQGHDAPELADDPRVAPLLRRAEVHPGESNGMTFSEEPCGCVRVHCGHGHSPREIAVALGLTLDDIRCEGHQGG